MTGQYGEQYVFHVKCTDCGHEWEFVEGFSDGEEPYAVDSTITYEEGDCGTAWKNGMWNIKKGDPECDNPLVMIVDRKDY